MSGTIESPARRPRRRLTVWFAIPMQVVLLAGCIVIGTDTAEASSSDRPPIVKT
jgi:hypothetical protein